MVSNLTVKWNDNATESKKLERIMVQKWIALFPDGQEAWSEMRRTGYPGIVTISSNRSGGEVPEGELISRLKFPTTEYSRQWREYASCCLPIEGYGHCRYTSLVGCKKVIRYIM